MAIKASVGMSRHRNPIMAGREAAESALKNAGIDQPDFVFMFATVGYNQQALLKSVREATGQAPLCGCSAEGVIIACDDDESNFSVAVMVIKSDELHFSSGIASGLQQNSKDVGQRVAESIRPDIKSDTVGMFVFPDGLTVNFDNFVEGIEETLQLDRFLPMWGGAAGENWNWKQTYQYCNDEIVSDGVAWALLSGNIKAVSAVNHGCMAMGMERKITRAEGATIYEIDGKPTLEVLKEYIPAEEIEKWTTVVGVFSLGFKAPGYAKEQDEYIIRAMIGGKDDETGSVTLPTVVSEGDSIWMTRRDQAKIGQSVDRIGDEIKSQLNGHQAKLVFQFDCAGRGKVILRDQQKKQFLSTLQKKFDYEVPWLGFYSYAEIGPMKDNNCLHNYTAVITALY